MAAVSIRPDVQVDRTNYVLIADAISIRGERIVLTATAINVTIVLTEYLAYCVNSAGGLVRVISPRLYARITLHEERHHF